MRIRGFVSRPAVKALAAGGVFLAALGGLTVFGAVPVFLFWVYVVMSIVTVIVYGRDKAAARQAAQRTPENSLHLLSLLGGWPGALYAQQVLRHKTAKRSFRVVFWITLVLNLATLGYLISHGAIWRLA